MNMKTKKGQTKLLAAVAVFAMVFCVFAVAVPGEVDAAFATANDLSTLETEDPKTYDGVITHVGNEYTLENYNGSMFVVNNTITKITLKGNNVIAIDPTTLENNKANFIAAIYATSELEIVGIAGATLTINFAGTTDIDGEDINSAFGIYTTAKLTMTDVVVDFDILTKDKNGGARGVGIDSTNGITLNNVDGSIIGSNRAIGSSSSTQTLAFNGCDLTLEGAERAIRTQNTVTVDKYNTDYSNITANVDAKYGSANGTTGTNSDDEVAIKVMALTVQAGSTVDAEGIEFNAAMSAKNYAMTVNGTVNVKPYTVGDAYQEKTPTPGLIFSDSTNKTTVIIGADASVNVMGGYVSGTANFIGSFPI